MPTVRLLAGVLLLAGACGDQDAGSSGWSPVVVGELSKAERALESRLRDAEEVFSLEMSGVIRSATAASVAVPDLHSCGGAIAAIIEEIGKEKDVTIGRTSFRLRNPKNVPPEWAERLVREKAATPALFRHEDGRLAGLYPLRTQMACLKCHGDPETAPDALKTELRTLYPEDDAWGFEYSGVRGYIWVETGAAGQR